MNEVVNKEEEEKRVNGRRGMDAVKKDLLNTRCMREVSRCRTWLTTFHFFMF